ncbi:MAG: DUF302 domain-containing protein [Bacteroidales bacterium]|nr:DUF302 domain-containing protein [Bacteroidales bacterium]MDT8432834.1 DUF302 domain-containing protein [Bacteroidales bacterium]
MKYYIENSIESDFETAVQKTKEALKAEGFGVLSEIDVHDTLKEKLDVDFRKYKILGACNPPNAYKALQAEDKIGTMLPCNVIVQEISENQTEVAAVDPVASMMAVENEALKDTAEKIRAKLEKAINSL